jgi:(S)-2-hydroxyglutarate dehydrogenase
MLHDLIVICGGIVGLSTALQMLRRHPHARVAVIEKEAGIARHQTGHNSGVIHSGLYYRPGSLKAQNCRAGYEQLLRFCRDEGVPHDICGKVVVAVSPAELPALEELHRRGVANGLDGLRWLDTAGIREIEPHCAGITGLFVPQTGIVDYRVVSERYAARFQEAGGTLFLSETVQTIRRTPDAVEVVTPVSARRCRVVVSCVGLHADRLARHTQPDLPLRITPFRGEYFTLKPEAHHLVRNLIYPVPDPSFPFLGVHFTRMIGGGVEAGPNAVLAFRREGYRRTDFSLRDSVQMAAFPGFWKMAGRFWRTGAGEFHRSFSKPAFVRALQRLMPAIQAEHLVPAGAGVRAQALERDGKLVDDFRIVETDRMVHVLNAPSPAATSSLSIGETVAGMAMKHLGVS